MIDIPHFTYELKVDTYTNGTWRFAYVTAEIYRDGEYLMKITEIINEPFIARLFGKTFEDKIYKYKQRVSIQAENAISNMIRSRQLSEQLSK